jgi:hypothetical protein
MYQVELRRVLFLTVMKSIVTSYASYIIENVVEVLKSAKPTDKDSKSLWLAAIRTLRYAFEHDQDGAYFSYFIQNSKLTPFPRVLAITVPSRRDLQPSDLPTLPRYQCIDRLNHHLRSRPHHHRTRRRR